jgi:tetratricopeptide (TPR) repeat protein
MRKAALVIALSFVASGGWTVAAGSEPVLPLAHGMAANPSLAETTDVEPNSPLEWLSGLRSAAVDGLLLAIFGAFVVAIASELRRHSVVIEPIEVPKDLAEKGYTPQVVAQRIAGEIIALRRAARWRERIEEGYELSAAQLDFTVPTAGISYRDLVRYLRRLLRRPEERVQGELVKEGEALRITLRTRDGRSTPSSLRVTTEAELARLFEQAAFALAALVEPVLVADYWFWLEQRELRFEATLDAVRECLAHTPERQHHRAYLIWSKALVFQRRFAAAEEKLRQAADLAPRFAQTYSNWGNLLRVQRRFDAAAAKYWKAIGLDRRQAFIWSNLGNVCNDRHLYGAAASCCRRAIRLDPLYAPARSAYGYALWQLGRHRDAEKELVRAIDIDPEFAWSYLNLARLLQAEHRYDEAISQAQIAAERTTNTAEAYAVRGDVLVRLGRFQKAEGVYQLASSADPKLANGLAGLAFLRVRQRRYGDAIRLSEDALRLDRNYLTAWLRLADSLRSSGRLDDAEKVCRTILDFEPYQSAAHVTWGQVWLARRKPDAAIARFRRAIALDPANAWAWVHWGTALLDQHRPRIALRKFEEAVAVDPWFSDGYSKWGDALVELKSNEEALARFRRALERHRRNGWRRLIDLYHPERARREVACVAEIAADHPHLLVAIGEVLRRLGDLDEAKGKFEQVLEMEPKNSDALVGWGLALRTKGYRDRAQGTEASRLLFTQSREKLQLAIDAEPNSARARRELGFTLLELGSFKEALEQFDRANDLDPDRMDSWAWEGRGNALGGLLQWPEAISDYERALSLHDRDEVKRVRLLVKLGEALHKEGRYPEAIARLEEALAIDSGHDHAARLLIDSRRQLQESARKSPSQP